MKENYVLLYYGYVFIWVTSPIGFVTGCDWVCFMFKKAPYSGASSVTSGALATNSSIAFTSSTTVALT